MTTTFYRTNRFVSILPAPGVPLASLDDINWSCLQADFTQLHNGRYLLAAELHRETPFAERNEEAQADSNLLIVTFDGVPPLSSLGILRLNDVEQIYNDLERDTHFFHLINFDSHSFTLRSEYLSSIPFYYCKTKSYCVIASRLADLFALAPNHPKKYSPIGLLEAFTHGSPNGNRTLHTDIFRAYAGERIQWTSDDGLRFSREDRFPAPAVNHQRDAGEAIEEIVQLYTESVRTRLSKSTKTPLIPLSGGMDSRINACVASTITKNLEALTLGLPYHDDYLLAKRVAQELGIPHRLEPRRLSYVDNIRDTLRLYEGQVGTISSFLSNLPIHPSDLHRPLLHGHLGGSVAGAHTYWSNGLQDASYDSLAYSISSWTTKHLSPEMVHALDIPIDFDQLRHHIWLELYRDVELHQAAIIWDMENRQRLRTFRQIGYVADTFYFHCPGCDREIARLWLSLPKNYLENRSLLRQVFVKKFPRIGALPPAGDDAVFLPKTWNAATYSSMLFWRKLTRRVRRKLGMPIDFLRHESWHMWLGITPETTAFERKNLETSRDAIEAALGYRMPVLDDACLARAATSRNKGLQIVRRAMILSEYAKSLTETRQSREDIAS